MTLSVLAVQTGWNLGQNELFCKSETDVR